MNIIPNRSRPYQECKKCILDTTDYPEIVFDENGICNICKTYDWLAAKYIFHGDAGKKKLNEMLATIRKAKKRNSKYDCLLGISGGADSSYVAFLSKQWGLNPLVVHIDNGWNSELAVKNIEVVLKALSFDLYTYVINWEDMKDMHLSFLKASVVDIELPYDNTFLAALYKVARKFKLKHILIGDNIETEGWLPPNFNHNKMDSMNIRDIHKRFGMKKITDFPSFGIFREFLYSRILNIKIHSPLNFIEINKAAVKSFLIDNFNWRDYKYKHYENIFTRFYQGYILPVKFGIDKRKSHLSTLICSGQMAKEMALVEIAKPIYTTEKLRVDKEFVIKKLGLEPEEFDKIMALPIKKHTDYKSYINYFNKLKSCLTFVKKYTKKNISINKL
jgi:N-acetyl sugar amidotransferase